MSDTSNWPGWEEAEANLREAWERGYPNEKIIKLEQAGPPDTFEKEIPTGETKIDEYGEHHAYIAKSKFVRIPAKALVQQGAGQKIFSLAAVFQEQDGDEFVFEDMLVGGSQEVVQAGQETPTKDQAKQLIAALWESMNPGVKVTEVKCADLERKSQSSKGRWWYATGADLSVTEADGSKKVYSNDMTNIFKGVKGAEGVDPSGDWKCAFIDKPQPK